MTIEIHNLLKNFDLLAWSKEKNSSAKKNMSKSRTKCLREGLRKIAKTQ